MATLAKGCVNDGISQSIRSNVTLRHRKEDIFPIFPIFPIHMNEIERKQERDRLKKEALSFYKAIETRDPSAAKALAK